MDIKEEIDSLEELLANKGFYIELIRNSRKNIAKLKHDKILVRAELWLDATGTVDQKKDFVKSKVADFDFDIANEEANIEYSYNRIDLINDKLCVYYE